MKILPHLFVFLRFFTYLCIKKEMARKKKQPNRIEYTPSRYQQAIYDYIEHESGNLVVEAAAGSGKTTTLIKCVTLIPNNKRILLCAFNKDIVGELKKKTSDLENVTVMTLHGLGLKMLTNNYPTIHPVPNSFKYDSFIKNNLRELSSLDTRRLSRSMYCRYVDNIKKYVDYGRYYMCQTERDLDFIEDRYDIETIRDEKSVALEVMEWGKTELEDIDFVDMIWFPHVLNLQPHGLQFDYIMVDECQDMNKAERELILKCRRMGTRLVSVGDSNQMLYSFAGGDPDSFNALKSIPNTKCLPLSISYRCPKNVVDFAKKLVPTIEANEANTNEGKVLYNVSLDDVAPGDMVLCRNNAPLIQVYNEFLKLGKKAFIRGKDIGSNLKNLVKSTKQEKINLDCREDGLFVRLYDDLFVTRNKLMEKLSIDAASAMKSPIIDAKLDMIKALEVLSEGLTTTDELIAKIDEIFPKRDKSEGIALSTVHKAKGLEANNVFVVCRSLMPSKSAKKDWEVQQEHNLMYVAYTRAKNKLCFVDEKEFQQYDMTNLDNQTVLARLEAQVNRVLGRTTRVLVNKNNAMDIIRGAKKIEKRVPSSTTISINSTRKLNTFSDFFNNKKVMKIKR
jgi:DNA helicase-2/ATP-dependent DNA helicase PcrA